jgi:diguanylate cyclase (GGDEF)-like protein
VIRTVAERLRESLRSSDLVARMGDEFAVLLEDVRDASRALEVAERFQARLRVSFDAGEEGHRIYTSASIGIAVGAEEGPQELLRAADEASYQAKRVGKARSVVFAPRPTRGGAP